MSNRFKIQQLRAKLSALQSAIFTGETYDEQGDCNWVELASLIRESQGLLAELESDTETESGVSYNFRCIVSGSTRSAATTHKELEDQIEEQMRQALDGSGLKLERVTDYSSHIL
jgi:hypothetical protein